MTCAVIAVASIVIVVALLAPARAPGFTPFPGDDVIPPGIAGTCRVCGCTDARACPEGCAWADGTETLCTSCVAVPDRELET